MLRTPDTAAKQTSPGQGTAGIVALVQGLKWDGLDADVKHAAKRHFLDTLGVIIAGASGDLAGRAEDVLAKVRAAGSIPVPGRRRRADLLDAAYIAGTAGHGIELDDGYRRGSVHPGVVTVPAIISLGYQAGVSGRAALEATVIGYEAVAAIARACHPDLRQRGFHPTGAVGVFGAAAASARLLALPAAQIFNALGIAASSAAGIFAFINGGADIKRLHAGHASRDGLQAALQAQAGIEGPPDVLEVRDGFTQAFAFGRGGKARVVELFPAQPLSITDCYIKPYACCRHIQPAVEALIELMNDNKLSAGDVRDVQVDTYSIAAEHAHTGWQDYASAQLSFPYIMALGMKYRWIKVEHFEDKTRLDPEMARLGGLIHVDASAEMDRLYPENRPARVSITTDRGTFQKQAMEALGAREVPLDDRGLANKFHDLVDPVLGKSRADTLLDGLWRLEEASDICSLLDSTVVPG
jgi:2-methylcitrate dehydratase PrpD